MLKNKKGVIDPILTPALCVFGLIAVSFVGTVMNGTFAKQVDKIKAAHNAPITVDKDVTGNGGNLQNHQS